MLMEIRYIRYIRYIRSFVDRLEFWGYRNTYEMKMCSFRLFELRSLRIRVHWLQPPAQRRGHSREGVHERNSTTYILHSLQDDRWPFPTPEP